MIAPKKDDGASVASRVEVALKWIFSLIIGLLFLVCLAYSKVSLLVLSNAMQANNDALQLDARCRIFVLLQIISLSPDIVNFIRGVWYGVLRKDTKWPKKKILLFAIVISIFESIGLCLFIFCIPGLGKTHHVVLLMNCVILLPISAHCLNLFYSYHTRHNDKEDKKKNLNCFSFVLAVLLCIAGIVFTILLPRNAKSNWWYALVGVVCLSISWIPSIQKIMAERERELNTNSTTEEPTQAFTSDGYIQEPTQASTSDGNIQESTQAYTSDGYIQEPDGNIQDVKPEKENTAWKLTALMSLVKIGSTFGFSMLILFYFDVTYQVDIDLYKNAWLTLFECTQEQMFYFYTHITSGFVGYFIGYIACTTRSQTVGFSIPLALATPLSVYILAAKAMCHTFLLRPDKEEQLDCSITDNGIEFLVAATCCFFVAQGISIWWTLYYTKFNIMLRENQIFWTPMYNSALLEHWIMLVRRNEITDCDNIYLDPHENANQSRIFICTTMYRENEQEMKQLLESFRSINSKVSLADPNGLKCHFFIVFDNAVKAGKPREYFLQLVVLIEEVLGTKISSFTKSETPYGMSLTRKLQFWGDKDCKCTIFLKDNTKVKSKKRWSQVMYMKYVLDNEIPKLGGNAKKSYILTTDADVKFTPKSVEALLDLITRDDKVGAVCARTHPQGSGALVWYQVFEYAIGHWFLKASEHVLGTVLCSPGCFSVFRCEALQNIINVYATNVEKAEEFLTKDMGEDRWLCTLLVQNGWRIEYCATASNSTFCPESFDELFKQRRRWIVSTLVNQWLLIKEWSNIKKNNLRVSYLFKVYQIILLVSTLIGPSSVMVVVSGGLKYGKDWDSSVTLSVQAIASICYGCVCYTSSQKTQHMVARMYSSLYTLIMMIAIIGTAVEIVSDINGEHGVEENFISEDIRISTTSAYLIGMAGIFIITAVLHLYEFWIIFYGFIYILGLPSGYLILMIYSICNITDRTWGTRDVTQNTAPRPWKEYFRSMFKTLYTCCTRKESEDSSQHIYDPENQAGNSLHSMSLHKGSSLGDPGHSEDADPTESDVENWLSERPREAKILRKHGFEKTSFISGITKKELKRIGIKDHIAIAQILKKVETLSDYEIPMEIPESIQRWLKGIDLEQYKYNFKNANINEPEDLEILVDHNNDSKDTIKTLNITKAGHVKRLRLAIRMLQKPSEAQRKKKNAGNAIDGLEFTPEGNGEDIFWENLRNNYIKPTSSVFESDAHLKEELRELRNRWLIIFAMINALWLILISTLADKGKIFGVFGSNPVGFAVVVVYGAVLVIQFMTMIVHRLSTFLHYLGTIPYKCNSLYHSNWLFPRKSQTPISTDLQIRPVLDPQIRPVLDPQIRPVLDPQIRPVQYLQIRKSQTPRSTDLQIRPVLDPQIRPVLDPQIRPVQDLQIRPVLDPQIRPVLELQIRPVLDPQIRPVLDPQIRPVQDLQIRYEDSKV